MFKKNIYEINQVALNFGRRVYVSQNKFLWKKFPQK